MYNKPIKAINWRTEMTRTKQVGWFVVGEGECGQYVFGTTFETMDCSEDTLKYWKSRGYDLVEALVPDDWSGEEK
jgi:hypothetical protein